MAGRTLLHAVCAVALMTTAGCKTVSDSYDHLFSSGKPAVPPAELVSIKPDGHAEDRVAGQRRFEREERVLPGARRQRGVRGERCGEHHRVRRGERRRGREAPRRPAPVRRGRRGRRPGLCRHLARRSARVRAAGQADVEGAVDRRGAGAAGGRRTASWSRAPATGASTGSTRPPASGAGCTSGRPRCH